VVDGFYCLFLSVSCDHVMLLGKNGFIVSCLSCQVYNFFEEVEMFWI
jgi:hypothetical protein